MARTTLKLKPARKNQYGVVTVFNADGSVSRRYRITRAEYMALDAPGDVRPPGVNAGEKWIAHGRSLDVGEMLEQPDGSLRIKVAEDTTGGDVRTSEITLTKDQFTGTPPNITVTAAEIAKLDLGRTRIQAIDSITNGEVQWQQR